jgi:hypothetical protein
VTSHVQQNLGFDFRQCAEDLGVINKAAQRHRRYEKDRSQRAGKIAEFNSNEPFEITADIEALFAPRPVEPPGHRERYNAQHLEYDEDIIGFEAYLDRLDESRLPVASELVQCFDENGHKNLHG